MAITEKQLAALNDKSTVVIIPAEGVESQIALKFLNANAPKVVSEQRVFDELHLLSLQGQIKVCVVHRSPARSAKQYKVRVDGTLVDELRPEKELMDEVIVTFPIEPKFTREGPMKPLVLDVPGFLEAIGIEMARHSTRLDYVDKGEQRPQILRLSWS